MLEGKKAWRSKKIMWDPYLYVGDTILLAHGLDPGGSLLVGKHGHVWPHVVLDLHDSMRIKNSLGLKV